MKKFIIHTLLFTMINYKLQLLGLSDNEIDFIDQLLDYAFDYLYDIFEHYLYPKIIKHIKRWTTMIKEYIIDVKSRMW
jgi:hemerythrin